MKGGGENFEENKNRLLSDRWAVEFFEFPSALSLHSYDFYTICVVSFQTKEFNETISIEITKQSELDAGQINSTLHGGSLLRGEKWDFKQTPLRNGFKRIRHFDEWQGIERWFSLLSLIWHSANRCWIKEKNKFQILRYGTDE